MRTAIAITSLIVGLVALVAYVESDRSQPGVVFLLGCWLALGVAALVIAIEDERQR